MRLESVYDVAAFVGGGSRARPGRWLSELTGDYERGHLAARNLLKPLNHLAVLRAREADALALGTHRDAGAELYAANGRALAAHQAGTLSTRAAIAALIANAAKHGRSLSEAQVRSRLSAVYQIEHLELHPSDVCNLKCRGCTYGHDDPERKPLPVNFPFGSVDRIAALGPKSILFIGGGEPLLYKSGGKRFFDLVGALRERLPTCRFALVSNGTFYPPGDWAREFDWIRYSVDAASAGPYAAFRGRAMFERVLENLRRTLRDTAGSRTRVGIGYLYCRANAAEIPDAIDFYHRLARREGEDALRRFSIQFRPLRRDPKDDGRAFPAGLTADDIGAVEAGIRRLCHRPSRLAFIRDQTNCEVIGGGNEQRPFEFDRCYYSSLFRIVRAGGELRPCFIRVVEPEFRLGDLIEDSEATVGLNVLFNAGYLRPGCDASRCRQCHINWILGEGLAGRAQPSNAPDVASDPFF